MLDTTVIQYHNSCIQYLLFDSSASNFLRSVTFSMDTYSTLKQQKQLYGLKGQQKDCCLLFRYETTMLVTNNFLRGLTHVLQLCRHLFKSHRQSCCL